MATAPAGREAASKAEPEHPKDRWDTAYVWAFICKFTNLRSKIEGLDSAMDLEEALLFPGPTPVLEGVLINLIRLCRPNSHTRLEPATILKHLTSLVSDRVPNTKDHIWYDDRSGRIIDPLAGVDDFFTMTWQTKLDIIRQLADWILVSDPNIRQMIDATRMPKPKPPKPKKAKDKTKPAANGSAEPAAADKPEDEKDGAAEEEFVDTTLVEPIGFDLERRRYWIIDDSGRMYRSMNPWKMNCPFNTISSSREELQREIDRLEEELKKRDRPDLDSKPPPAMSKWETSMRAMVAKLKTEILPRVEVEEIRVTKIRRKLEAKQAALAQAELRATRTRRQTKRPAYVYNEVSEDDGDEFIDDGDGYESDFSPTPAPAPARAQPTRKSGRLSEAKPAIKTSGSEWRGERRSSRLGGPSFDEPLSAGGTSPRSSRPPTNGTTGRSESGPRPSESVASLTPGFDEEEEGARKLFAAVAQDKEKKAEDMRRVGGLSKVREGEVPVEELKGKKKSKFWFYAVEPIVPPAGGPPPPPDVGRRRRQSKPLQSADSVERSTEHSEEPSVKAESVPTEDVHMRGSSEEEFKPNGAKSNGTKMRSPIATRQLPASPLSEEEMAMEISE